MATLLLQAEVATVIPDDFFRYSAVTSIDFSNVFAVDVIGNGFLRHTVESNLSGASAATTWRGFSRRRQTLCASVGRHKTSGTIFVCSVCPCACTKPPSTLSAPKALKALLTSLA